MWIFNALATRQYCSGRVLEHSDYFAVVIEINAQEGTTKGLRQWRFTNQRDIKQTQVKAYVLGAIQNEREGKAIKPDRNKPVVIPPELKTALAKKAFAALTPGKQREYANHIASAKQAATKTSRLQKILPLIEAGGGLHDKYRDC